MATPFPFTIGQTLTAAQLNAITTLPTTTKTASHTLVIADQGTRVIMNSASATTITVNTSIFGASDVVEIQNIGAGVCTVTAGTSTVSSAGSLAIPQHGGGRLVFSSASAATYFPTATTSSVQIVSTITGAVATGTTQIPMDDTIPQNTEGDQYMSLAITPTSATNILIIQASVVISSNGGSGYMSSALFQDSTANALAVVTETSVGATEFVTLTFNYKMAAGTTSATTFKIRCGLDRAGTTTFNGFNGNRKFGGVSASSIIITEYPQ